MNEPDDDNPPEWYEQLERDIRKALLKDVSFFDRSWVKGAGLWDLVNTGRRYPNTVPVLLDWLEHLDERLTHRHLRWEGVARHGLNRALVADEAKCTRAVDLMIAQFHHEPPLDKESLYTAANALKHLAGPEHFDQIAQIVQSRPSGRSPLIEWLGKSRRKEVPQIVADQLDDPEVATWTMKTLRRKALPPELAAEIRPTIERYLDYPGDKDKLPGELRKQAKLTMDKLYPAA